ncbi:LppU/SCO3897 family protein [Streptodolium elevatio]|uniref:Uncharacterized protein n=1 Tax=Streptodolium elevatio TaxID=3157996 RepID=A0ABV3DEC8_9ACTN
MHDRPEPDEVQPTPYLPAWLDGAPSYEQEYGREYAFEHDQGLGPDPAGPAYAGPEYGGPEYGAPEYGGPEYGRPEYGGSEFGGSDHGAHYGAQYEAHYGSPQYGPGDFDEPPTPYQQLDRYEPYDYGAHGYRGEGDQFGQPPSYGGGMHAYRPRPGEMSAINQANPPAGQQYYPRRPAADERPSGALVPRANEPASVPSRRERREVAGRGEGEDGRGSRAGHDAGRARLGRPMRRLLAFAVVACLGVFGYWGWTFYDGEPAGVREGSCIAALGGTDVKPMDCTSGAAKYTVLEVFKGAADATTCAVVQGATDPMVVHRDGRTDVWCVAPNERAGSG